MPGTESKIIPSINTIIWGDGGMLSLEILREWKNEQNVDPSLFSRTSNPESLSWTWHRVLLILGQNTCGLTLNTMISTQSLNASTCLLLSLMVLLSVSTTTIKTTIIMIIKNDNITSTRTDKSSSSTGSSSRSTSR